MELTYEDENWHARSNRQVGRGATPLDALIQLAAALAPVAQVNATPELMADAREDWILRGQSWSASVGDSFETSGPDPAHVMYQLCEQLEAEIFARNLESADPDQRR